MTTCAEAEPAVESLASLSSSQALDGSYIDWDAVDEFLYHECQAITAGLPYAHSPTGDYSMMPPRARATHAVMLVTTLEMMYGQDIGATYTGPWFSMDDFRNLLIVILEDQDKATQEQSQVPFVSAVGSIPSGKRGWWSTHHRIGMTVVEGPFHYPALSANAYALLRRNATALQYLYDWSPTTPWRVLSLEHKLIPTSVRWPFDAPILAPSTTATEVWGGGLTGLIPWMDDIVAAGSLATQADCLTPGTMPSNFWGEVIGVVLLDRICNDTLNRAMCWARFDPAWNSNPAYWTVYEAPSVNDGGLGEALANCFDTWQQRGYTGYDPTDLDPIPYLGPNLDPFVTGPCPCEWNGTIGNWSNLVPSSSLFAVEGQDWDCGLHQLTRAVTTMYFLGRSWTSDEQEFVVKHLDGWLNDICFEVPVSCQPADFPNLPPSDPIRQPQGTAEMYLSPGVVADPCYGYAYTTYAPSVDTMAAAALALVRCGATQSTVLSVADPAVELGNRLLEAVSTLYRAGATGGQGWMGVDTQDPFGPAVASLEGTFFAVATLRVLNRTASAFATCAGAYPASNGPNPDPGLDTFFDVFGGGPAMSPSLFPAWADAFYQWNGMTPLLNTLSYIYPC